jgi:sugar lactone lactonase YvrE
LVFNTGPLTAASNSYRLYVTDNGVPVNSNTAVVTVLTKLTAPTIAPGTQQINYNTSANITYTLATGSDGNYTYQWQTLNSSNAWVNSGSSFQNPQAPLVFNTGPLTAASNSYRLYVTDNGVPVNSNTAVVTVCTQLKSGTISTTTPVVNIGVKPAPITSTLPVGGCGTPTYQWQSSTGGAAYGNISGATQVPYTFTSGLTATTSYQLLTTVNGVTVTSLPVTITVIVPPCIAYATPQIYSVNTPITPLSPSSSCGVVPQTTYGTVSTIAGSGTAGISSGIGKAASFNYLNSVATDSKGNVYAADVRNNEIRKIDAITGAVTVFAGSPTGAAGYADCMAGKSTTALFNQPYGVAVDSKDNVYVADYANGAIRIIGQDLSVGTFAVGVGAPLSVAVDALDNVYVADGGYTKQILKVNQQTKAVTALGGGGAAGFIYPIGVAVDKNMNVFVADVNANKIMKIDQTKTGVASVSVYAGTGVHWSADGSLTTATFSSPSAVATDGSGNVYVTDAGSGQIRIINQGTSLVNTVAGSINIAGSIDGVGSAAGFNNPYGLCVDGKGNLYVADYGNEQVRKIIITGYAVYPALPAGLSLQSSSGTISGTPTAASAASNYYVTAFNTAGSGWSKVNIAVSGFPCITYVTPQIYSVNTPITPLSPSSSCGVVPQTTYGTVSTIAGSGTAGISSGIGKAASFNYLNSVATDSKGNVYAADVRNNEIRKIDAITGAVTVFAGSPTGAAGYADCMAGKSTTALFNQPYGVAVDSKDNVYVADYGNGAIRIIGQDLSVGTFTTGVGAPLSVAIDATDNVYVADGGYIKQILKVDQQTKAVTALGGGGAAGFIYAIGVAVDKNMNVYVADVNANKIMKIDQTKTGVASVSVYAGTGVQWSADGGLATATFNSPSAVATDGSGNVYVSDAGSGQIRIINQGSKQVNTVAGSINIAGSIDGVGAAAGFNSPQGLCVDGNGNLYVADMSNQQVRKIIITGYTVYPALPAGLSLASSSGIISGTPTVASMGTDYFVSAFNSAGSGTFTVNIAVVNGSVPPCITLSSTPPAYYGINTAITPIYLNNPCSPIPSQSYANVTTFAGSGSLGSLDGPGTAASFNRPWGMAADAAGNIYVADISNNAIRKISSVGLVSTISFSFQGLAGTPVNLNQPTGVAVDAAGNVYVADAYNNLVRKISPAGIMITLAGSGTAAFADGIGTAASFNFPSGVAVDAAGNVYVTDAKNYRIRVISPSGVVTTLAGSGAIGFTDGKGATASFNSLQGITIDAAGYIYAIDLNCVRKISPAGVVTTIAGNTSPGLVNGIGTAARFYQPGGICTDAIGNIYVSDTFNNDIRMISLAGVVTTLAGNGYSTYQNGIGTAAGFYLQQGITTDATGNLYVADRNNDRVRKVTLTGYSISPALPAGLTFNYTNGSITGTPTAITASTTYTITAYNTGGSSSTTLTFGVAATASAAKTAALLATDEPTIVNAAPYPMPFTSTLNINLGDTEIADLIVKIFDAGSGNQVYFKQFTNQAGVLSLDVSNLSKGVYSLHLVYNNQHKIYKVFK